MGGSYPVAFGSRGSCSVHAKMKERFSKRTKVRAMLCKGVPSCQCHGAIAVITHPYPNDLNLWTHRSRKRQKPRLLWEQPTSHHKKHTTVKNSWKMEKLRRFAPSFLGIQQIQQEPGFPSGRLPTFPHQRAPPSVPGTGNLLHLDQLDLEDVVWISFLGPRWYSSIKVRYSGWSTHLLRWLNYVKLGRTTYSNTCLRLSSGTEIGAMVLWAVRTFAQRDSTYEAQQHEKIPQQKINCSLLGWCPPCSLKLVCFMFTEKVIYAGWLIGIPLTNCDNPYYN